MSFHTFFFNAIDKIYYRRQNCRRETRFEDLDFDIVRDIVYDPSDGATCRLDVCRLRGTGSLPVIFYIHGGGFEAGDKHCRAALARWFAALGYAVVNVNYGPAPRYRFPAQHVQLCAALGWVQGNAAKYGFDLSRVICGGDSAGAYYAAALACIADNGELQSRLGASPCIKFGAMLLNCGVYDMVKLARSKMIFRLGKYVFRDVTGIPHEAEGTYEWRELLDIPRLVTPRFPQSFVTCSRRDTLCRGQTESLLPALEKSGVPAEVFCATGPRDDHCFSLMWRGASARRCNALLADFLRRFAAGGKLCGMRKLQ